MAVQMPGTLLLTDDHCPNPSPDVGIEGAERNERLLRAEPKVPKPAPQVTVHCLDASGHRLAPRPRCKVSDSQVQPFFRSFRGCHRYSSIRGFSQMESEEGQVMRSADGTLFLVHHQTQAPFDELADRS